MRLQRMGRFGLAASLGQGAWAVQRQWRALPVDRRARLQALLRQSAGGPSNLSAPEREELRALLSELNLSEVLHESTMRTVRRGFRRR